MRRITCIVLFLLVVACDSENANDCFQKTGEIVSVEVVTDAFSKILVNRDVELILKEGVVQKVVIETGKNLLNEVHSEVIAGRLILTDNNTCNFVRDYGVTKVYVTSPNITEIRSSTQYDISSDGILTYPELSLLSEDFNLDGAYNVGDFRLQVNSNNLKVVFNNLSSCFVSGTTNSLEITFAAGNGRFEGGSLTAQNVIVSHRGSNDMIVNPQQSIKGIIRSTGHVISKTTPPVIDVEELYQGRLIFE